MSFDQCKIDNHQRECAAMKETLPDGEWKKERDRYQWVHQGLDCLMVRHPSMGNWCGYVGVPKGHKLYGADYDEAHEKIEINVHGGLTYANKCQHFICHNPEEGKHDDVWWFGFDCAHAFDLVPAMVKLEESDPYLKELREKAKAQTPEQWRDVYRNAEYVKKECEDLAKQLRLVGRSWFQRFLNSIGLRLQYD